MDQPVYQMCIQFISDSRDRLAEDMTAEDNLAADHKLAVVQDIAERDIRDSPAVVVVVVHIQAVEDSRHSLDSHQGLAGNSCRDCNPLATVVQWDTACWSELLDTVLLALFYTNMHKYHCTSTHRAVPIPTAFIPIPSPVPIPPNFLTFIPIPNI